MFMVQEQDKSDVQAEAARKKMKSRVMSEAGLKAVTARQAPKNPRKNNTKKTDNTETVSKAMETSSSAMETGEFRVVFHAGLVCFITM